MVQLAVDMSRAAGRRTGVGRYLEYLVREWSSGPLPFERVTLFTPAATIEPPADDDRFVVRVLPSGSGGIRWQIGSLRSAASKHDLLFAPYAVPPGFRGRTAVSNLGIYEGPNAIPGWRARAQSRHFAYSARRADAVIANSAATKRDLSEHYHVDPDKIEVIWPGVDPRFTPRSVANVEATGAVEQLLGRGGPYLLFVGKLSLRRNVPALLEAFAQLSQARRELRLVLVGPDTSGVAVSERAAQLGLGDEVIHIDHLEQHDLATLYRHAAVFVLPTAAEGFSFTILEALASGAPIVTLEHDALTESGLADVVLAIPKPVPEALSAAIRTVLDEDSVATRLRSAGPQAAARFSWADNARRTMEICASVAASAR